MTPNRYGALGASAASVVAILLAVLGAVDSTPKAIVVAVAIIAIAIVAAVFLVGGQKWDELVFRRDTGTPDTTVAVTSSDGTSSGPSTAATGDVAQTGPRSDPQTVATKNALTKGPELPDGEDPDPIDSAIDHGDGDDPLLLQLLDPSKQTGAGYVYGDGEVPPIPDERDDNVTAFISADDPDAQSVDPIPTDSKGA